jgi:hypothetical protein
MQAQNAGLSLICPFCKYASAGMVNMSGEEDPLSLDGVVLCTHCGEWSMADAKAPGCLRQPSADDYQLIGTHPVIRAARELWLRRREQDDGKRKKPLNRDDWPNPALDGMDASFPPLIADFNDMMAGYGETDDATRGLMAKVFLSGCGCVYSRARFYQSDPDRQREVLKAVGIEILKMFKEF